MAASRVARATALLDAAERAARQREAGTELRCPACGRLLMKYDPPIGRVTLPCRRCSEWIDFGTERSGSG
jgi:hypothetical protein